MTEIEKMFENAGTKKIELDYPDNIDPFYPDFTAEKQIELIKWLAKIYELSINWDKQYNSYRFVIRNYQNGRLSRSICNYKGLFEETLAYLINGIWQSLTDQEKEEIRNILK